jgi:hypothetical protein
MRHRLMSNTPSAIRMYAFLHPGLPRVFFSHAREDKPFVHRPGMLVRGR